MVEGAHDEFFAGEAVVVHVGDGGVDAFDGLGDGQEDA